MKLKHFVLAFCCLATPIARAESEPVVAVALAEDKKDATERIAAALAKAGEAGGGEVYLPAGNYRITRTLVIPSGVTLRGETKSSTRLVVANGVPFDLLSINGVQDVAVRDLTLQEEGEAGRETKGAAIAINNGSRFVQIENVNTGGFLSGFCVGRADQAESSNIVFRGCRVEKTRLFGFELNNCREVLLDSCYAFQNWLDGIKFRKKTRDITIRGGESSYNGTSRFVKGASNGNGVDAFAGGEAFLIDGLVTEHNQGSGIYLKTGTLNEQGFGVVGDAMISNVRSRYNVGNGLDINRSGGDMTDAPLLANVTVIGGVYEGNTASGIYARGRNIAITAPIVRGNGTVGITLSSVWNVAINSPIIVANSQEAPGRSPGISLGSVNGVRIRGGVINGFEGDTSEPPKEAIFHSRAITVNRLATDVEIGEVAFLNWALPGDAVQRQPKKQ